MRASQPQACFHWLYFIFGVPHSHHLVSVHFYKILLPLLPRMLSLHSDLFLLCRVNYFHFLNTLNHTQEELQLFQIKVLIKVFSSTKSVVPKLCNETPQGTAANSQECYRIFYVRVIHNYNIR